MKKALWIIPVVVGVATAGTCLLVKNTEKAKNGVKHVKKGIDKAKNSFDKSKHWAKLQVNDRRENLDDVIEAIKHPEKFDPHNINMTEEDFI